MPEPSNDPKSVELSCRQDFTAAAFSIERDFRGLVETLRRTMAQVDSCDKDLLESFANTKAVAQRGLRLSKLLVRRTRRRA